MYFKDKQKRVDYILVWEHFEKYDRKKKECAEARCIFETNLKREGLQLEYDDTVFVFSCLHQVATQF